MKHDSWFQKNGEINNDQMPLLPNENPKKSPKQPTNKKKKTKEYHEFFSEEEKQFNDTTKGFNLFKMFFS